MNQKSRHYWLLPYVAWDQIHLNAWGVGAAPRNTPSTAISPTAKSPFLELPPRSGAVSSPTAACCGFQQKAFLHERRHFGGFLCPTEKSGCVLEQYFLSSFFDANRALLVLRFCLIMLHILKHSAQLKHQFLGMERSNLLGDTVSFGCDLWCAY